MFDSTQSPRKNLKTSVGAAITMLVLLSACSQQSIDTDDKQLDQTTAAQQIESTPAADSSATAEQSLDQSLNDASTSADGTFSENSSDSSKVAASDEELANQVQADALPPGDASPSMSPLPENDPMAAPVPSSASMDSSVPAAPAKHAGHKKHSKHGKVASHKKHKHGKKIAKSSHKKSHKKDLPAASSAAAVNMPTQIETPKDVGSTLPTDAVIAAPVDQMPTSDVKAAEAMNAAVPLDPTMSASPTDGPMAEPLALSAPSTNWKVWGAWAALMIVLVGAFVIRMKKRKGQGVYYNP